MFELVSVFGCPRFNRRSSSSLSKPLTSGSDIELRAKGFFCCCCCCSGATMNRLEADYFWWLCSRGRHILIGSRIECNAMQFNGREEKRKEKKHSMLLPTEQISFESLSLVGQPNSRVSHTDLITKSSGSFSRPEVFTDTMLCVSLRLRLRG